MSNKNSVSFRIGQRQEQEVEQYRSKHSMSESDAYRELVDKGLRYDELEKQFQEINERLDEIEAKQQQSFFERILP